jgi:hypothetical protein
VRGCERAQAIAIFKRTSYLLRVVDYPFSKACFAAVSLMGVKNFSRILLALKKLRRFVRRLKIRKQETAWVI